MAISYRPRAGDILECDFGQWTSTIPVNFDGHIQPEMRKRRMVVVLNGNLDGSSCLVVPISSTNAITKGFSQRYHIALPREAFPTTNRYDVRDRWALCDRIAVVSKQRLFCIKEQGIRYQPKLERSVVTQIQEKIIHVIGATSLLNNQ